MANIVLFAVGSPLVVEYEETCARLGVTIEACVRNRPGSIYSSTTTKLIDPDEIADETLQVPFLCPLFTPRNRWIATQEALGHGLTPAPALIDPTSVVARSAKIGDGSYVNASSTIGAQATVSQHAVINRSASIGHHSTIGTFSSIGPGVIIAGEVCIGPGVVLGSGSIVLPRIRIGANASVAAGSVVSKNVAEYTLVHGNPAKVVKTGLPDYQGVKSLED